MKTSIAFPAVELTQVTKNYGKVNALKNINLSIEPGEVVAFLGPNGAGKSTSLCLMLGMRQPSSGTVSLFGRNPRHAQSRKHVGVMLQESGVPEMLKVQELIELFGRFYDHAMSTKDAISMVGLSDKARARVGQLSGGQKQRVYFALALVGNPDILFLDEPTTKLDVEARHRFWEQIQLQVTRGKTIILTTHNLEEADSLASRIVVINHGEIIADGTPAEIKQHVGGKHICFRSSNVQGEILEHLPGVQNIQIVKNKFDLYTTQPELLLATLFHLGTQMSDLEVVGAALEEAFLSLTSDKGRA